MRSRGPEGASIFALTARLVLSVYFSSSSWRALASKQGKSSCVHIIAFLLYSVQAGPYVDSTLPPRRPAVASAVAAPAATVAATSSPASAPTPPTSRWHLRPSPPAVTPPPPPLPLPTGWGRPAPACRLEKTPWSWRAPPAAGPPRPHSPNIRQEDDGQGAVAIDGGAEPGQRGQHPGRVLATTAEAFGAGGGGRPRRQRRRRQTRR